MELKNTVRALTANLKNVKVQKIWTVFSVPAVHLDVAASLTVDSLDWVCFVLEMCFVFNHQGTISYAATLFVNASHSFHTFTVINEDMTLLIYDLILYTEDCFELWNTENYEWQDGQSCGGSIKLADCAEWGLGFGCIICCICDIAEGLDSLLEAAISIPTLSATKLLQNVPIVAKMSHFVECLMY